MNYTASLIHSCVMLMTGTSIKGVLQESNLTVKTLSVKTINF